MSDKLPKKINGKDLFIDPPALTQQKTKCQCGASSVRVFAEGELIAFKLVIYGKCAKCRTSFGIGDDDWVQKLIVGL